MTPSQPFLGGMPQLVVQQPLGDPGQDRVRDQHLWGPIVGVVNAWVITRKNVLEAVLSLGEDQGRR